MALPENLARVLLYLIQLHRERYYGDVMLKFQAGVVKTPVRANVSIDVADLPIGTAAEAAQGLVEVHDTLKERA